MNILVINCGSSSLKYQLIDMDTTDVLAKGNYEMIGSEGSFLTHKRPGKDNIEVKQDVKDHGEAIKIILDELVDKDNGVVSSLDEISAIGHRVVHGGTTMTKSELVTPEMVDKLVELIPIDPLHNPGAVATIQACQKLMPEKPMAAVFDTSFHQTIPEERYLYPIPYEYYEKYGIRKYGFHGTSFRFVTEEAEKFLGKSAEELKMVICHLGQGASLCAVKDGKSVDTSMGYTSVAGIEMVARSGDLDPSVVTHIMDIEKKTPAEMDSLLNKKSGMYGISGVSDDFRFIEKASREGNERAMLAIKMYAYNVAQYVAKYCVALQGMNTLVFTGGIGEHQSVVRRLVCENLKFMGIEIDEQANIDCFGDEAILSTADSKITVAVVPTNEELMIAKDTVKLAFNK